MTDHTLSRRAVLHTGLSVAALSMTAPALTACGGGGSSQGDPVDPTRSRASAVPTYTPFEGGPTPDLPGNEAGAIDGFFSYPADSRAVWQGDPPGDGEPVTALAQLNSALPPALEQNPYWQELNRRIGSPMQVQLITAGEEFNAKIATMSAGGDFPDFMQINNTVPALAQFLEAKMLDLTPYLGGDAAAAYPALANIPTKYWEPAVFNGGLFGLPISRGVQSSLAFYARTDLLEEFGADAEVASFDDLRQRAVEVTDPRQNRWAFANIPLSRVRQMLAIPGGWHLVDGAMVNSCEDERQQQALEAVRVLQADELLVPDVASAPPPQQQQWFGSGRGVFYQGTYSAWTALVLDYGIPAEALTALPMFGFDGGRGTGWIGTLNNNLTVIPKSAEGRIDTLLKVADYLASPFGSAENLFLSRGIEGRHYELSGTEPERLAEHATELGLGIGYLASAPPALYNPNVPGYVEACHQSQSEYVEDATADLALTLYSATSSRRGAQLSSALVNLELDIIFGRQPVSAWADGVARWRADGGDTIREELQQALEAS